MTQRQTEFGSQAHRFPKYPAISSVAQAGCLGARYLFFGNLYFDSCRIVPAMPSALAIVRKAPVPPKRPEDEILGKLM